MKYIVIGFTLAGCLHKEVMVTFGEDLVHSMVFDALVKGGCIPGDKVRAISAGEISRTGKCSGYSRSLELTSREVEDTTLAYVGGQR